MFCCYPKGDERNQRIFFLVCLVRISISINNRFKITLNRMVSFESNRAVAVSVLIIISVLSTGTLATRIVKNAIIEKMEIIMEDLHVDNLLGQQLLRDDTQVNSASQGSPNIISFFDIYKSHQPMRNNFHSSNIQNTRSLVLGSFNWKNCGQASDSLVINSLTVNPDPIRVPGNINLAFDVTVKESINAPVKMAIELKKKEIFWIPIPCIDGMGSCTYDDVCEKMKSFTCPQVFIALKIPCKCPFSQGSYNLPSTAFNLDLSVPGGSYQVQVTLSSGSQAVSCTQATFNVA